MANIDDCTAAFAIASWANRPTELAFVRRTIDAYLRTVGADPASQRSALRRLFSACDELRLDSRVAITIQDEIADRLRSLRPPFGFPPELVTGEAADKPR